MPMVLRTMAPQVNGAAASSAASASLSHCSRSMTTWYCASDATALATMRSTSWAPLPWASSSFAAVSQIAGSVGMASRAWLSTRRAFSYVSSRASASHMSTEWGTHSTARPSMMRASSTSSSSMAVRQSFTDDGTNSSAFRSTVFFRSGSGSSSAARSQSFVDVGSFPTASASMDRAFASPLCSRAASSQTSSDSGHVSQPSLMSLRAAMALPAISSTRAAAIQPGACFGFVVVTDFNRSRAFLMSPTSDAVFTLMEFKSVR
mmetsp:Transcript_1273/g.4101  ORF Transcript_1273/g.4101 Transcript_1273/m.4101 type:complete len:262 (-) Transcript_1273:749-1534(-)